MEFILKGGADYLKLSLLEVFGYPDSTFYWGGFDARFGIEIKSRGFSVKSELFISTGQLFELNKKLLDVYENLTGQVFFESYEGNLTLQLSLDKLGHVSISGHFSEQNEWKNGLHFEFQSDQSYFKKTLSELHDIVEKYGDMTGVK